jgi:GTP-binding protein Era
MREERKLERKLEGPGNEHSRTEDLTREDSAGQNVTKPVAQLGKKAGTVALVGRPNAGKSTLMNCFLEEKLAIVSNKPQTTRDRIVGILSTERGQMVFYDTPGVHKPQHQMNRRMVKSAQEALNEADAVCLLVDAGLKTGSGDHFMLEWLKQVETPVILLLNKIDNLAKPKLLPLIAFYAEKGGFQEIIPVSALKGDGTEGVLGILWNLLPDGPPIYDSDLLSIHPERFLVAERIREKVLERTREELPFSVAVLIDSWEQRSEGLAAIYASILVEREGQKGILVGSGGSSIKAIGQAARLELEEYLGHRVFLDLRVKVRDKWRENERILSELERAPFDVTLG